MKIDTQHFNNNATKALKNQGIQSSLDRAMGHFDHARPKAINEFTLKAWEDYKDRGREIKRHAVENLDYYLGLLADRVEHNGGVVHFARDANEANNIVLDLANEKNVKLVTKSKSMLSEEMALNDALENHGIQAVETDLGEYVIQLADESPFHIVAPAMHKSKEEVSNLFVENLNVKPTEDIPKLARLARLELRQKFLQADMGISGVNFAIAETGTIALITNEGNGRMCTSLPRIHVALMGMEKVIPSLDDLAVMLNLLPRAATGQRITSYVTLVSGPRRRLDEDGPDEFHLVIIDNGRSKLLGDSNLREALYCIRCGACLNVCPVYRNIGGHSYGWVYQGPIGSVITPMMVGLNKAKDLPFASSLCGACKDVCPVRIDIPRMLIDLRTKIKEDNGRLHSKYLIERITFKFWSWMMGSEMRLALIRKILMIIQLPLSSRGYIRWIPFPPFSRWTRYKDLPRLSRSSFHKIWRLTLKGKHNSKHSKRR